MLQLSEIYIYPIKSLGGIRLENSNITPRGLENDRRFMLVDENGVIRSGVFPGLWLAVDEWLAGNMMQVFAVLQAGLASLEQSAFVEQRSQQQ